MAAQVGKLAPTGQEGGVSTSISKSRAALDRLIKESLEEDLEIISGMSFQDGKPEYFCKECERVIGDTFVHSPKCGAMVAERRRAS